jgi:uncharacterized protein
MNTESLAPRLDVKSFAQSAREISGHDSLSNYERLLVETHGVGADRLLNWSAQGEIKGDEAGSDQIWLHVQADVILPLTCQRCLAPVDSVVSVSRSFRFVSSEEEAEQQDDDCEEDVLALTSEFKLSELIEDEILMELPLVPRHDECPSDVVMAAEDANFEAASAEKRNPFAVLAKLQDAKLK